MSSISRPSSLKKGRKPARSNTSVQSRINRLEAGLAINVVNSTKFIQSSDTSAGNSITNSNPFTFNLNSMSEGLGENNARIGDKVRFKRLHLRCYVFAGATVQPSPWRFLIIREKTALGSAVSPTQYFFDATPGSFSNRNFTTRNHERYVTYLDKTILLGPTGSPLASPFVNFSSPAHAFFSVDIPLNFTTDYSRGNSGTVTDIDTNSLCFMIVTDNTTSGAFIPHFEYVLEFTN